MINADGEVRIGCTLLWGYERGCLFVSCSHLSWNVHACWPTSREVCILGLRAGRFVELDH